MKSFFNFFYYSKTGRAIISVATVAGVHVLFGSEILDLAVGLICIAYTVNPDIPPPPPPKYTPNQ